MKRFLPLTGAGLSLLIGVAGASILFPNAAGANARHTSAGNRQAPAGRRVTLQLAPSQTALGPVFDDRAAGRAAHASDRGRGVRPAYGTSRTTTSRTYRTTSTTLGTTSTYQYRATSQMAPQYSGATGSTTTRYGRTGCPHMATGK